MSFAECQNNLIDVNFHLQNNLEIFDKNSAEKFWSKNNRGGKCSPSCQLGLSLAEKQSFLSFHLLYFVSNKNLIQFHTIHFKLENCKNQLQIQRVPALCSFWDLEKIMLHEIRVRGTVLWSPTNAKIPTCMYISQKLWFSCTWGTPCR